MNIIVTCKRGDIEPVTSSHKENIWTHFYDDIIDVNDGYHTFTELYDHRLALTVALFKIYDNYITPLRSRVKCWKSKLHNDGTMFEEHFVVGMSVLDWSGKTQQITYHYKLKHWDKFNVMELDRAPVYDGHTAQDVIERLMKL
jgi:hypothetical protein